MWLMWVEIIHINILLMFMSLNMTILVKKRCLQLYRALFVSSRGVKDQNNIFHLNLFSLYGFDPSRVTAVLASGQMSCILMQSDTIREESKRLQGPEDLEGFP